MPSAFTLTDRVAHRIAKQFPARIVDVVTNRPIVSFTFDDVPVSALENGANLLERHGVRGTFYVAGGLAGARFDGQTMLDASAYRALARAGHELAHHTFTHRAPMRVEGSYRDDLDRNDAYLWEILHGYTRNFAFPYGLSSLGARRQVTRRFRSGRGVEAGINRSGTDLDLLHSVEIGARSDEAELVGWIDEAVARPGWLIYFTHDVQATPTPFGTRPELLEALVARAVAAGCEVLTIDAALDRLGIEG